MFSLHLSWKEEDIEANEAADTVSELPSCEVLDPTILPTAQLPTQKTEDNKEEEQNANNERDSETLQDTASGNCLFGVLFCFSWLCPCVEFDSSNDY